MAVRKQFGTLIKGYREARGWDQPRLAREIRALLGRPGDADDHNLVSRMESRHHPTLPVARAAIEALHAEAPLTWKQLDELATAYLLPDSLVERARPVGEQRLLALIVPNAYESAFWARVAQEIEAYAAEAGFRTLVFQHYELVEREASFVKAVAELPSLYGLAIAPAMGSPNQPHQPALGRLEVTLMQLAEDLGIPSVFIDRTAARTTPPPAVRAARRIPCVAPDNVAAARAATERLIQAGHRRIAILDDFAQASYYAERERGYRDALAAHGLAAPDGLIRRGRALASGPYTMDAINRVALVIELLRLPPGEAPTALFAANYHYALAALEAVRQLQDQGRSLAVPGDLSVIGFDDVPEFRRTAPAITCVHYPIRALAQVAIDKLLALIADPRDAEARADARIADIQIAERDSIAPPPTPHPA